jgi:Tfp pilus assembly protein PilF
MKFMKKSVLHFFISTFLILILSPAIGFCQASRLESVLDYKLSADNHLRNGKTGLAIEHYRKALDLDPSFKAVYFNLAIAHYTAKDKKSAAWALEKLVALDPSDTEALYNLACLSLCQKDIPKAVDYLKKAKGCCGPKSEFEPLIENAVWFIDKIEQLTPAKKEALLSLLEKQGLPTLPQA